MKSNSDLTSSKNRNRSFRPVSVPLSIGYKVMYAGLVLILLLFNIAPSQANVVNTNKQSVSNKTQVKIVKVHPRSKSLMKRRWGVEVVFVRQNAAGYMLEFRYKVLDAEKAKPLFERQTKPILIHARTGAELVVPTPAKTGALRN